MIADITAAWTAITAATKAVATALNTAQDAKTKQAITGIQDHLIDVQTKLLAAQSQYETLAEAKRQAEQKVIEYEKWDSESARYELRQLATGIFVYSLKTDHAQGESPHWLCPNCFQQRQKSILTKPAVDYLNYECHRCEFDVTPVPFPGFSRGDDIATYESDM